MGFRDGSTVKNPHAMQEIQEMWIRSLGQEDPLEEGMTTYSSILAWRIPGKRSLIAIYRQRSLAGYIRSVEPQRVCRDWVTEHIYIQTLYCGLQSCPLLHSTADISLLFMYYPTILVFSPFPEQAKPRQGPWTLLLWALQEKILL